MATGREEAHEGRLDGFRAEEERRDVAVQVIHRCQRNGEPPGERLRSRESDEQRADEPGSSRCGDEVDVCHCRVRVMEGRLDDGRDELEVAPRGHFGNDAAERRVQLDLRGDDAGEHVPFPRDQRRSRLVAGGLEPEDHCSAPTAASRHMITASSRLSV